MKYSIIKFNNGNGALLCNGCSIIIDYGFKHEDRLHFCKECADVMVNFERELSHRLRLWKKRDYDGTPLERGV